MPWQGIAFAILASIVIVFVGASVMKNYDVLEKE
jgi:hypothetical protein